MTDHKEYIDFADITTEDYRCGCIIIIIKYPTELKSETGRQPVIVNNTWWSN